MPNFIIRKFRVPPFLLPIYQAAGIQYGVRWEVLAAINEIETDYGRNLNVSSAGAVGWMQFIPSTWRRYGTDANEDGRKDPYNPVDAIFAAARYLAAAGYDDDVRRAVFAYNHADWYVDSVLLRARLIAGVPADLVGSLTGLTEGRFPIYARARYADDLAERDLLATKTAERRQPRGREQAPDRHLRRRGAPVVAVNDGVIKKVAESRGSASTSCSRTPTATASPTRTSAPSRALPRAEGRRAAGGPRVKARPAGAIRRPPPRPPRAARPILRLSPTTRLRGAGAPPARRPRCR